MIVNLGLLGYGLAALAYLVLSLLLVVSWKGRLQGGLLVAASLVTAVWGGAFAYHAYAGYPPLWWLPLLDVARHILWLLFLIRLFHLGEGAPTLVSPARIGLMARIVVAVGVAFVVLHLVASFGLFGVPSGHMTLYAIFYIALSVVGLMLVEQLLRNTHPEHRWKIKFLCIGIGGMFVYDLFLYSDALLLRQIDREFWNMRGVINAAFAPLIAIAAARNRHWSIDIFVSRKVVFHTATLLWVGLYLIAISAGGYYVRVYGGDWGTIAQAVVLGGAAVLLLVLLFSGNLQARLRLFLTKHFYRHRYDYRDEWLKLMRALASSDYGERLGKRVLQALAQIVDSRAAVLFLRTGGGDYESAEWWKSEERPLRIARDDPLVSFMRQRHWLIDLDEYRRTPELYGDLRLPGWLEAYPTAWLLIPLIQHDELEGFALLTRSLAPRPLDWEDRDLLKTAGQQAAGYLALERASAELADARQFEAFNRLSAYVVHDLKNVVGQLALVVSNSKKFKDNQAFVDDAFATVENAVKKMERMLAQLRQGRGEAGAARATRLRPLVEGVVAARQADSPAPALACDGFDGYVVADADRLASVIEHVISNAQDATPDDGFVRVRLYRQGHEAVIEIEDNGCGMDADFIRNRLFKPFDTTKGNAGMGIGAYECREFIRSIGGDVVVESAPGVGSTFRLLLPLLDNDNDNKDEQKGTRS